jgi:hypothetical protein
MSRPTQWLSLAVIAVAVLVGCSLVLARIFARRRG